VITEQDLQAAIAECQGARNPNASTCIKLAAYYTIKDKMFPDEKESVQTYSFAKESQEKHAGEINKANFNYDSGTEFSLAISGKDPNEIFGIIDELMTVLEATNPRLYNGVMRKINS